MTVTNSNATGTEQNHVLEGLTVRGGLLLVNAQGQSIAFNPDSGSNLLTNGTRSIPREAADADYQNGVTATGGLASGTTIRESMPARAGAFSDVAALADGVMTTVAVTCYSGDVVKGIACRSGATATNTPVNWWFALYDTSLNLMSQTADQLTAAWAANTTKDLNLTAQQTITTSGVYYAAIMVHASVAVPSLVGETLFNLAISTGLVTGQKVAAQTSGSSLTTTAPGSISSPTSVATKPYVVLHS